MPANIDYIKIPESPLSTVQLINNGDPLSEHELKQATQLSEANLKLLRTLIAQTANEALQTLFLPQPDPIKEDRRVYLKGQLDAFLYMYNSHFNTSE